jgi:hypothetical protein
VVYITLYFPTLAEETFSHEAFWYALALDAPAAMSICQTILAKAESGNIGLDWDNIDSASVDSDEGKFAGLLGMLAFDVILYGALAWYFDQIVPQEFGVPRKPGFLFTRSYWCPKDKTPQLPDSSIQDGDAEKSLQAIENLDIEPCYTPIGESGIRLLNLGKVFNTADGELVRVI